MDHATKLQVIDGETLMDMELAAPKFCVQGLLPQGLCILGGAPKIGKSWLMLDLCVRIAKGGTHVGDGNFQRHDLVSVLGGYLLPHPAEIELHHR